MGSLNSGHGIDGGAILVQIRGWGKIVFLAVVV
jgi:hypothetical protein